MTEPSRAQHQRRVTGGASSSWPAPGAARGKDWLYLTTDGRFCSPGVPGNMSALCPQDCQSADKHRPMIHRLFRSDTAAFAVPAHTAAGSPFPGPCAPGVAQPLSSTILAWCVESKTNRKQGKLKHSTSSRQMIEKIVRNNCLDKAKKWGTVGRYAIYGERYDESLMVAGRKGLA
jgi:hypothetical protein